MKYSDMLFMSASNLWKRKLRTLLTILGVVIGVASIVVMISLGMGLSRSMMSSYESFGSMTEVSVSEPYESSTNSTAQHLDDELVEELSRMEHVQAVYPVLQTSALGLYGGYSVYLNILGMPEEGLKARGIELEEGTLPSSDDGELRFLYGSEVIQNFINIKTGKGYWETGYLPELNWMEDTVFIVFDTSSYYASQSNSGTGSGTKVTAPKKYIVPACGVEAASETGSRNSWYTFCDIDELKKMLKKVYKNTVIPGQPTAKNGKAYKTIFYSELYVEVDDMDNVMTVKNAISDMGYNASTNAEWISSAQQSMNLVQMVLGGIGAVSLIVAAIGIANTMMMSIYERTREIGVMKVLGCGLKNIRTLFLLEAAMIGFIGGITGACFSYIISAVINFVSADSDALSGFIGFGGTGNLSYIPFWLTALAILFATVIAMIAGFFPAQKAMRLSPLAAIRNE